MLLRLLYSLWYQMMIQIIILLVPIKFQRAKHLATMNHLLALYYLNYLLNNHLRKLHMEHSWRKLHTEQLQDAPYRNVIKKII